MRSAREIADAQMAAFTEVEDSRLDDDEPLDYDVVECSAQFIRDQIEDAIEADRAQRETYRIADLDGTVDEADWLTAGHVLDEQEVEWLRTREIHDALTGAVPQMTPPGSGEQAQLPQYVRGGSAEWHRAILAISAEAHARRRSAIAAIMLACERSGRPVGRDRAKQYSAAARKWQAQQPTD